MKRSLVYIIVSAAVMAAVAYFAVVRKELSLPGALLTAHAALEADCQACHDGEPKAMASRCSSCHTNPDTDQPHDHVGFARHHTYTDLNCLDCHAEHRGRTAEPTRPGREFDKVGCAVCHVRHVGENLAYNRRRPIHPEKTLHADHAPWQGDCLACHTPAGGRMSAQCAKCHQTPDGQKVTFTGFAAHHTYTDLECLACHTAHQGRDGTLLRANRSFRKTGCETCHARHVGKEHVYVLAADKHPEGSLRDAHSPWQDDCSSCHRPDGRGYTCTNCHDPENGERLEFYGYASHHVDRKLDCLSCHSEHHGPDAYVTREAVTFENVSCTACHSDDVKRPRNIVELPEAVRGHETVFRHDQHPEQALACRTCHPMEPDEAHVPAGTYDRNCSACHHGTKQKRTCASCHSETADYLAGRFEGRFVTRGTHGKADKVGCAKCHKFDPSANSFKPAESTCASCHPPSYTNIFKRNQASWAKWRRKADSMNDTHSDAVRLRFVARNWYHNDTHALKVRKQHPSPGAAGPR